jgi:cytochrome oxidase Cu insertion factor (SCO1/SenC/PrrC family)
MKILLPLAIGLGLAFAGTTPMTSQDKLPPADVNRVKAGDVPPDFTLEDQDGNRVTLSSFRGKKQVVLVFYRGVW